MIFTKIPTPIHQCNNLHFLTVSSDDSKLKDKAFIWLCKLSKETADADNLLSKKLLSFSAVDECQSITTTTKSIVQNTQKGRDSYHPEPGWPNAVMFQ